MKVTTMKSYERDPEGKTLGYDKYVFDVKNHKQMENSFLTLGEFMQ